MQSASDDLTKPLGADRGVRKPSKARRIMALLVERIPFARIVGGSMLVGAIGIGAWLVIADDRFGGEPHVVVDIREGAAPEGETEPSPPQSGIALIQDISNAPRANAGEVERASGVSVLRPDGAGESGALIIQVPQDPTSAAAAPSSASSRGLAPAPDPRLIEQTRHGLLPRIGDDGAVARQVYARPTPPMTRSDTARVAIIVTGMGISQTATAHAIDRLPEDVSLGFAPYGGDLARQAARARAEGHEIFLQAPMEPFDYPRSDPGPHTLTTSAGAQENLSRLHWVMGRINGFVGIVNFMGARLTGDPEAFRPVLTEIGGRGLAYVDDGSSARSLAPRLAGEIGLPLAIADMVLDTVPDPARIDAALARLEEMARERGLAVASASALPMTVDRIAAWADAARSRGVLLVPVSAALAVPAGG